MSFVQITTSKIICLIFREICFDVAFSFEPATELNQHTHCNLKYLFHHNRPNLHNLNLLVHAAGQHHSELLGSSPTE